MTKTVLSGLVLKNNSNTCEQYVQGLFKQLLWDTSCLHMALFIRTIITPRPVLTSYKILLGTGTWVTLYLGHFESLYLSEFVPGTGHRWDNLHCHLSSHIEGDEKNIISNSPPHIKTHGAYIPCCWYHSKCKKSAYWQLQFRYLLNYIFCSFIIFYHTFAA